MDEKQTPSPKTESMTMVNAPSRKQNVACDACRSRKVKCLQVPGQAKCQHCLVKKLECRHLIQQATSEKRRVVGTRRSKASPSENSSKYPSVFPSTTTGLPAAPQVVVDPLYQYSAQSKPPFGSTRQRSNPTIQLVDWLFSPPDTTVVIPPFVGGAESAGYRNFAIRSKIPVTGHTDTDWEDLRSHLEPDEARTELANDLVEVYFQICHNRLPLLDSNDFRTRLRAYLYPTSTLDPNVLPLPPSLLVTVIAWGAKFSEHPLLVHDRAMNAGKSRLSRLITKRAREVAEGEKVHRVPSCDNVIIALLLEPLHSHNPSDLDGLNGFWLNCAVRHLFEMGINRTARLRELDEHSRAMMAYAWFMACICDAFAAVYWRRKPVIEADDFDVGFVGELSFPSFDEVLSTQDTAQNWIALLELADISRKLARDLSKPSIMSFGIPLQVLQRAVEELRNWKEKYLRIVGVPDNYQANWDFIAAVSACTCDAQYHVMWVILHSALDEFNVREAKKGSMSLTTLHELEKQVFEEALQGALRISGLTSVLTSNGYLRLDPNILHFSTYAAGMFLARYGKVEVKTCIQGLEQYSFAYEEAHEQAKWMQQVYSSSMHQIHQRPHSVLSTSSSSIASGSNGVHPQNGIDLASSPVDVVYINGTGTPSNLTGLAQTPYLESPSDPMIDPKYPPISFGH